MTTIFGLRGSKACFVHEDDMFIVWVTWKSNGRRTVSALGQVAIYLLIHDDVHFNTSFSPALEESVEAVILVQFARPPEI